MEDQQSMTMLRDLVNKYRLIGIAAWRNGMETADIWPVFNVYR
ncbi:hypothetical protein ACFO8Q_23870 [Effusibacillus consociatus]|uniref:Uncharacterized protein n=1 Tax=Effusibacillus consociatus TaxID=1117041 RepID=A0ABV9Q803_9BACL